MLVLDFDGTVCLGDGPIWSYAEAAIAALPPQHAEAGESLRAELARFLAAEHGPEAPGRYSDGYAAVASLAAAHLDPVSLAEAYYSSRAALARGEVDVVAAAGIAELLTHLRGRARRVLVTNAPALGLDAVMQRLGLAGCFDDVIGDADKPTGWSTLLPRLAQGLPGTHVMSVGDIWANDIAGPLAAGCITALIDRFHRSDGHAHLVATRLDDVYDDILAWASDPTSFAQHHSVPTIHPHPTYGTVIT